MRTAPPYFEHPGYIRAPGLRLQQLGMKWFTRLVGAASTKLALSLYEAVALFIARRRAAHSLKSNSETLGAFGLAMLARELEAMARAGSLDGALVTFG